MFDLDDFTAACVACLDEDEPRRAIRELLARTVAEPEAVADRLRPETAGITPLYHSPELTVLDVVWAPKMHIFAHDHRMWAAISIYAGREDNAFFRRPPDRGAGLVASGGKQLDTGDVTLLGADTIHVVTNPTDRATGAIHVYGGDFFNQPRSQWLPPANVEEPWDTNLVHELFARENAEWKSAARS
jgi:predicted metal-dependent enzyme (double-stranded beta helix superfamily)